MNNFKKSASDNKNKTKKNRLIFNIILDIFLGLFVIFALYTTISGVIAKKNNGLNSLFGKASLSVQSESMSGTFEKGDLIFVDLLSFSEDGNPNIELKENKSIVTFKYDIDANGTYELVTHLFIGKNGERYEFVGTYNPTSGSLAHQLVSQDKLVGVYNGTKWSGFGNVTDFLSSPTGYLCVIMVPCAIFFIYAFYKFIKAIVDAKPQKVAEYDANKYLEEKEKMRLEILKEIKENENKENK